MNKQELQEYIKNYIQEKTYVGKSSIDDIEKDPDYQQLPSSTKMDVKKRLQKGETATLEEESQTYGDAITKTYMYLDAIYDRLEDMDPESSQAQELKSKFDDFNDNILKPLFRELI